MPATHGLDLVASLTWKLTGDITPCHQEANPRSACALAADERSKGHAITLGRIEIDIVSRTTLTEGCAVHDRPS
jgi:hypothetical protein